MKRIALWVNAREASIAFYFKSPYLSPLSYLRRPNYTIKRQFTLWFVFTLLFSLSLIYSQYYLSTVSNEYYLKSYLSLPLVYFSLEFMGRSLGLFFSLMTNKMIIDMHLSPWKSLSLNEFWGKRWNVWVRDWILTLSKPITKFGSSAALFISFMISGLFHEMMVALPYYLLTGNNVFGFMLCYFLIQFLGIRIEKILNGHINDTVKLAWTWFIIIMPIPFFINDSIIYFLGY